MNAALDISRHQRHSISHRPWCPERLRGLVLSVASEQATSYQLRDFHRLVDYLEVYVAAAHRTRAKRFAVLAAFLSTGVASQAAELWKISPRTARDWVDDFFQKAADELDHSERAVAALREDDKLRAARDAERTALRDFLNAYCQLNHPKTGTGRTVETDPSEYRGTSCPACCVRAGLFGPVGWGG